MLEEFLARFYDTISFAAGESFPSRDFRILFRPDALLLEQTEGAPMRPRPSMSTYGSLRQRCETIRSCL